MQTEPSNVYKTRLLSQPQRALSEGGRNMRVIAERVNHLSVSRATVAMGERCIPLAITLIFVGSNLSGKILVNNYYSKLPRYVFYISMPRFSLAPQKKTFDKTK